MRSSFGFADTGSENGIGVGLVAFGKLADELSKYHKGDTLMISGNVQENDYTNKAGDEIKQMRIMIDCIAGVKKVSATHTDYQRKTRSNAPGQNEFNDEIPFCSAVDV